VRAVSATGRLSGNSIVTVGFPTRPLRFVAFLRDTVVKEGQLLDQRYTISPQDPGRTVWYGLVNPPKGASIDSATGMFTWTPASDQSGTYTIVAYATDGQYTVVTTALLSVLHVNRKPTFHARIPSLSSQVLFNSPTLFAVSVSDPDGDRLTIAWKVDGVLIKSGADTTFTYTVLGPFITKRVTAIFSDPFGLSDSTEWVFLVNDIAGVGESHPNDYALFQNYPNPFNPWTSITLALPRKSSVLLAIYNMEGQQVRTLLDRELDAGMHTFFWDGSDNNGRRLSSGAYFCRMRSGVNVLSRKMLLLR
jgi:hypothetical protein